MLQTFALFDFDGTLIHGDSIILFMRYLWRRKLCTVLDLLRFVVAGGLFTFHLISPKRAKEMGMRFLKGRKRADFVQVAEDFCETVLKPRLYPQGVAAVRRHQAAGRNGADHLGVADVLPGAAQANARSGSGTRHEF